MITSRGLFNMRMVWKQYLSDMLGSTGKVLFRLQSGHEHARQLRPECSKTRHLDPNENGIKGPSLHEITRILGFLAIHLRTRLRRFSMSCQDDLPGSMHSQKHHPSTAYPVIDAAASEGALKRLPFNTRAPFSTRAV